MTFAFLAHPRARLREDMALVSKPLGLVPERVYDAALQRLRLRPFTMASVHLADRTVGHVVLVPFGARHMLARPGEARHRVVQAVNRSVELGADVVGLGALTAPVTAGGKALRNRTDVGVTNGNAYTAAVVDSQVRRLLDQNVPDGGRRVAVVGATGSVGATVVRLLARDGAADRLTLVARNRVRLRALQQEVADSVPTLATDDLAAVRQADLVVLLTASADALLQPGHLGQGAVVLDATQPRNTAPELLTARPDVLVLDGGIVDLPGLRMQGGTLGLPAGQAFACFAETALLGLSGHRGHFSLGAPTLRQVDEVRQLARDLRQVGFQPAEPTCFGRPVLLPAGSPTAAVAA